MGGKQPFHVFCRLRLQRFVSVVDHSFVSVGRRGVRNRTGVPHLLPAAHFRFVGWMMLFALYPGSTKTLDWAAGRACSVGSKCAISNFAVSWLSPVPSAPCTRTFLLVAVRVGSFMLVFCFYVPGERASSTAVDAPAEASQVPLSTALLPRKCSTSCSNNHTLVVSPRMYLSGLIRSVVDPLRRLAFDPLAATKRNYADRVLLARNQSRR